MLGMIPFAGPVRLLHGQQDKEVSYQRTIRLAELIANDDVQIILVKDGDHRLSRDADLALLIRAVDDVADLVSA